jgi:hypothetical protein
VVHGTGGVDFRLEVAGIVGELCAGEDVKVVVGSVSAGVAFGADGGTEDDEVFGYAWGGLATRELFVSGRVVVTGLTRVNNVHGAHGAASVVEDPLLVEVHVRFCGSGLEVRHDVGDDGAGVVSMLSDCGFRKIV